eukprot:TRINITY_DN22669_c0_g1_i1.p1 TRINITY_DN22669_c0_g1~~TRINITY_DN22669_c0_g1_i1.p1  ORF type:complete len:63 (-),score=4.88 TRINITY_DN22669_c0_g1_i1:34-222(-)
MRIQLCEKGESIVGDLGLAAKLLIKNSDVHEELTKIAKKLCITRASHFVNHSNVQTDEFYDA